MRKILVFTILFALVEGWACWRAGWKAGEAAEQHEGYMEKELLKLELRIQQLRCMGYEWGDPAEEPHEERL